MFTGVEPGAEEADVIELAELSSGRTEQVQWAMVFEPVMREVKFDPKTAFAQQWWPLGTSCSEHPL